MFDYNRHLPFYFRKKIDHTLAKINKIESNSQILIENNQEIIKQINNLNKELGQHRIFLLVAIFILFLGFAINLTLHI